MKYLIRFEDEDALKPQIVGQKFYALAKSVGLGFSVPRAVAVSTAAHRFYLANQSWPDGLLDQVYEEAAALELSRGLSIRSSATREDQEKQSFAGQYRSFLQVANNDDLENNIERCWKSVDSETVRSYLTVENNSDQKEDTPLMAVVIQKMVDARIAGIAFGRNPMKPTGKEIIIEAVKGLAEDLVSGHRTPYRAVVKEDGMVKITLPSSKSRIADETEHLLHSYPFWRQIARMVKDLEIYNGKKALDVEWAVDDREKIWLLQSRTITTLDNIDSDIPAGLWTRKIANDLWADRLTPFLAQHMVKNAPRYDLSRTLKILGIPVVRPTLAVIKGYLYINGDSIIKGLSYLPHKLRLPDLDSLLPASIDMDQLNGPSFKKLFSICIRSFLLAVLEPGVNPLICKWLAKYDLKSINRQIDMVAAMPDQSSDLAMNKLLAALDTLTRLQIKNQWPYFFATFMTWLLRWLTINRLGMTHVQFLELLGKEANNISIEIEQQFRKMAGKIARYDETCDRFMYSTTDRLVKDLPPEIRDDLNNFFARYGCRSRHRTLFIKRWDESPQEVLGILQSLVGNELMSTEMKNDKGLPPTRSGNALSVDLAVNGNALSTETKLSISSAGVFWLSRLILHIITRLTRRFLDLREDLRFTLDRILYLIRKSLLTLGEQSGLDDKIMFLNENELTEMIRGILSQKEAGRKAFRRYSDFMRPFDCATFYNQGLAENEFQSAGTRIKGIGTSPGRVSGRAKIVDDPSQADIRRGDILVAKNTDPGWTPILSIVGGMVMEEGGLLNHCSIVARELGVPSIVGVHGATQRIQDNDRITIDGGQGVVVIEESKLKIED